MDDAVVVVQFHWQNLADLSETMFLAQTEYRDWDSFRAWIRDLMERRGSECPEGWVPLCCNEDAPMFVRAA